MNAAEKEQQTARYRDELITLRRAVRDREETIESLTKRERILQAEVAKLDIIIAAFVHVALTPEDKKQ